MLLKTVKSGRQADKQARAKVKANESKKTKNAKQSVKRNVWKPNGITPEIKNIKRWEIKESLRTNKEKQRMIEGEPIRQKPMENRASSAKPKKANENE